MRTIAGGVGTRLPWRSSGLLFRGHDDVVLQGCGSPKSTLCRICAVRSRGQAHVRRSHVDVESSRWASLARVLSDGDWSPLSSRPTEGCATPSFAEVYLRQLALGAVAHHPARHLPSCRRTVPLGTCRRVLERIRLYLVSAWRQRSKDRSCPVRVLCVGLGVYLAAQRRADGLGCHRSKRYETRSRSAS